LHFGYDTNGPQAFSNGGGELVTGSIWSEEERPLHPSLFTTLLPASNWNLFTLSSVVRNVIFPAVRRSRWLSLLTILLLVFLVLLALLVIFLLVILLLLLVVTIPARNDYLCITFLRSFFIFIGTLLLFQLKLKKLRLKLLARQRLYALLYALPGFFDRGAALFLNHSW